MESMKPCVLILSNSDSGLYDFRREVLQALLDEGRRVLVSVPDTGYVQRIRALGCEYLPTSFERRGMNPAKDLKLLLFYRGLMKRYRPEAVFTYTIKPNVYGGLAASWTKTPYLANVTGLGTTLEHEGLLQKLIVLLYRLGLKKASCVFFQNRGNRDFMQKKGCLSGKSRIIPGSGVNLSAHLPQEYPPETVPDGRKRTVFLSILRLMEDKGIGELLKAAQRIHARHPETVFRLLGAYEEETRARYEPLVEKLQKEGVLEYYGYRDDVPAFLAQCHALIHPSYHEGMSNVLLEAAATARPVLASAVEGCLDTFEDGVSGISFAPKDAESLEKAAEAFLALPYEKKREMGQKGREYVEKRFDRNLVVNAYLEELKAAETPGKHG